MGIGVVAPRRLAFVVTGRTGVGHLRRVTRIATAVRRRDPSADLTLIANRRIDDFPWLVGGPFNHRRVADRSDLVTTLREATPHTVLVDTASVAGLDAPPTIRRRVLILRRCRDVEPFRSDVPWDDVFIPHPVDEWPISLPLSYAKRAEHVGWVHADSPPLTRSAGPENDKRTVLVTIGGGGAIAADPDARSHLRAIIHALSENPQVTVTARVGTGGFPIDAPNVRLQPVTDNIRTEACECDLVIAAAGYNSVLELATIDTPVLLIPAARTHDDQHARAAEWAPQLGHSLSDPALALDWCRDVLAARSRRSPVSLPRCGSHRIAEHLVDART